MSESSLLDDHHRLTDRAYDRGVVAGLERAAQICDAMSQEAGRELLRAKHSLKAAAGRIRQEKKR